MRRVFWKIIVAIIVKNRTVHVMVATDNKFCIKITVIIQKMLNTHTGVEHFSFYLIHHTCQPITSLTIQQTIKPDSMPIVSE